MAAKDIAIRVSHVSKNFVLPHERVDTIKSAFVQMFGSSHREIEVQHALKNISFEVEKGEFFGIVGRNGSGKSTLLKILAGIYQSSSGTVGVNGKIVPFIELGVGFNGELTGRENVYLNGALLGFSKNEVGNMFNDIVEFADLGDFMDQKLKNYSSGMQVRLAFSLATRAKADVLLVDEVLAVGDADFQRKCFEYFKHLKKSGTTVIFVTHDMSAVREYCDRAILIDKNVIVAEGSADEVAQQYTRLFAREGSGATVDQDAKRWGDGKVKFDTVEAKQNKTTNTIHIMLSATAHADLAAPIFGFTVKAGSGEAILGTNSKIRRRHIQDMKTGDQIRLEWVFPNILSDGVFGISLAVAHEDGVTVSDWWDDAVTLTVYKDEIVPYNVMPEIDLTVDAKTR